MLTRIHVNQHHIKANAKDNGNRPVITAKTYKSNTLGHVAIITDDNGREAARVVYADGVNIKPLSCGARVWISTHLNVEVIAHEDIAQVEGQEALF